MSIKKLSAFSHQLSAFRLSRAETFPLRASRAGGKKLIAES
jgi:hypothetical protein